MFGYVYKTTNLINNMFYIGQHRSNKFDEYYKGSGKLLKEAFKKFGKANFKTEIIQWYDSFEELNDGEKYWIAYYNADQRDDAYNISQGGYKKEGCKGKNNGRYGVPVSKETRDKISKANKGRKPTVEQIRKSVENRKSDGWTEKRRNAQSKRFSGDRNPNYGNHTKPFEMTDEIKAKISKTKKENYSVDSQFNYGKICYTDPYSLESHYFIEGEQPDNWVKGNILLGRNIDRKDANNPRARALVCVETGKVFWGIKEAANYFNTNRSTLSNYIGRYNHHINATLVDKEK